MPQTLVAGIGNVFLGDDGFGVEVVNRLAHTNLPEGVEAADFGIRGVHLAMELAGDRYSQAILVDAVARGGHPGTLYVIEPEVKDEVAQPHAVDAHSLSPDTVLGWLKRIGGGCERITIVGCEPGSVEESMGLTEPVAAAVDEAVALIRDLVKSDADERKDSPSCV